METMTNIGRAFKERWDELLTFVVVTVTAIIHLASKSDPELAEQVKAELGRGQSRAAVVRAEVAAQIEQLLARKDS